MLNCATTQVPKLKSKQDCSTSLEGFFHSANAWQKKIPALIVKENPDIILYGKILSIGNDGIIYDPDKESPFYDPEEKFFPFTEIEMLINEKGELVYGQIPKIYSKSWSMFFHIVSMEKPEQKPMVMEFEQNHKFSFCLPEGNYLVKQILFMDKNGNIDIGKDFPGLVFKVNANQANYLGDIYLDIDDENKDKYIIVPYIMGRRNSAFPIYPISSGVFSAALEGAIVGIIESVIYKSKGAIGAHLIVIKQESNYVPELNMPVNNCQIYVDMP